MNNRKKNKPPGTKPGEIAGNIERNKKILIRYGWGMSARDIAKDLKLSRGIINGVILRNGGARTRLVERKPPKRSIYCGFLDLKRLRAMRNENN